MERRTFIRQSTAVSASLLGMRATRPRQARSEVPIQSQPLGVGVIGLRYQGSVIAERAKNHGKILAISDVDTSVLDLSAVDKKVTQQVKVQPNIIDWLLRQEPSSLMSEIITTAW